MGYYVPHRKMGRTITVYHVTPESNIEAVEETGLEPRPCAEVYVGDKREPDVVREGIYVTRRRRAMERYAELCLKDVRAGMQEGERFALFRADVDASRVVEDPESALNPHEPDAYICADAIDDPELVDVGILDEPAGDYEWELCR